MFTLWKKTYFICILVCISLEQNDGQRLSQGASDWYMRFHSNFRHVKRDVHPPQIKSFVVSSTINHRYSITEVNVVIENPAEVEQLFQFGFVMAKTALISNITLSNLSGKIIKSTAEASEWAHCFLNHPSNATTVKNSSDVSDYNQTVTVDLEANANGNHDSSPVTICDTYGQNRHGEHISYLHHSEDFKQFVLPITVDRHSNSTLSFVYEYLLERTDNAYTQTISVNPGQKVTDFEINLKVLENRPLKNLNVDIPSVGEINQFYNGEMKKNEFSYQFKMNLTEQGIAFGQHGYTGDFILSYDLGEDNEVSFDLVTKDDFFVHFYNIPESNTMKSIPKHVTFLLDTSESMSEARLSLAKSSVLSLVDALDESHYITLISFDSEARPFLPPGDPMPDDIPGRTHPDNITKQIVLNEFNSSEQFTLPCNNDTYFTLSQYFDNLTSTDGAIANITKAIETAIEIDQYIWSTRIIPENALSMIILVTDGRSVSGNGSEMIEKEIRILNKVAKIPIFTIGIGYHANMEFLERVAESFCGRVCMEHIFGEFKDVEKELQNVEQHLNNMVIKNLAFTYVGDVFAKESFTRNKFRAFHQGGSAVIAGQFDVDASYPEFKFKVSGQSANGAYNEESETGPFVTNGCRGEAILCSAPNFGGECISVYRSITSLRNVSFDDKTVSINISGNCAWIAFDRDNFNGHNLTLVPGSGYGALPFGHGGMSKSISSIRMVSKEQVSHAVNHKDVGYGLRKKQEEDKKNTVARLWAFKTIGDILERASENEITKMELERAYSLAQAYNFLTPFTVMSFVQKNVYSTESDNNYIRVPVDPQNITYGDLSPIFYNGGMLKQWEKLKTCEPPIQCKGEYHFELYNTTAADNETNHTEVGNVVNCTGSITLYTKSNYTGEALTVKEQDIYMLYHKRNVQKIRSIQTEGECCWNLFDKLMFSGNPDRICGDKNEPQCQKTIGSIKRNAPSSQ